MGESLNRQWGNLWTHDNVERERGKHICVVCNGTCCGATKNLIRCLVDMGEIKPTEKVGGRVDLYI